MPITDPTYLSIAEKLLEQAGYLDEEQQTAIRSFLVGNLAIAELTLGGGEPGTAFSGTDYKYASEVYRLPMPEAGKQWKIRCVVSATYLGEVPKTLEFVRRGIDNLTKETSDPITLTASWEDHEWTFIMPVDEAVKGYLFIRGLDVNAHWRNAWTEAWQETPA